MSNPQVAEHIAKLKDENLSVRFCAVEALGEIGDASAVPALIEALKDKTHLVRSRAFKALGKIGDASAVPALIEALKDKSDTVRLLAAEPLGKIGDVSAVPALIEALKDMDESVRQTATESLGMIGDASAVPALIKALKDKNDYVRVTAAVALREIGDSVTLPRKILADSQFSAQERIEVLDKLRRVRYKTSFITLLYTFPDARTFCQTVLNEEAAITVNPLLEKGAQTVLDWLDGDQHLVIGSQRDTATQAQELLRAGQGGTPDSRPETLLHASDELEKDAEPYPTQPTLWERLTRKRKDATF